MAGYLCVLTKCVQSLQNQLCIAIVMGKSSLHIPHSANENDSAYTSEPDI